MGGPVPPINFLEIARQPTGLAAPQSSEILDKSHAENRWDGSVAYNRTSVRSAPSNPLEMIR